MAQAGRRHAEEVEDSDRRWLLAAIGVFAASLVLLFGLRLIYRATGPHPEMTAVIRRMKGLAKRFLPHWRRLKADP